MQDSGAASFDAAPESSQHVEEARRSLYSRGGASPEAVAGYERMVARLPRADPDAPRDPRPAAPPDDSAVGEVRAAAGPPAAPRPTRRRWSWRVRAGVVGGIVLIGVAGGAVLPAPRPLPALVAPPGLPGQLLLTYSRASNPESAPRAITFEPTYYTAYQPRGGRVSVALRCIGRGAVRIAAGEYFTFHCTDREQVLVRTSRPISTPFLILGRTTGNVVWGVRIVLLSQPAAT